MDKTIFKTIDEAVSEVTKYCKDNNHPVRLGSRTTVAQYNKKTKDDANITDLPGSTIYALRWVCKHFGSERVSKEPSKCNYVVVMFTAIFVLQWCKASPINA